MATRLYPLLYRGTPLHKASNIYLPVLIPIFYLEMLL